MWHGAFGVLRAPSRDDDIVADDAPAAVKDASKLGSSLLVSTFEDDANISTLPAVRSAADPSSAKHRGVGSGVATGVTLPLPELADPPPEMNGREHAYAYTVSHGRSYH